MIAVIFEVTPKPERMEVYLELAVKLRPHLDAIDGFISIERFESLSEPGKVLSLSFWRDEAAVEQWRDLAEHRQAQMEGRRALLDRYRLRVAEVVRDYGMLERTEAPADSQRAHFP